MMRPKKKKKVEESRVTISIYGNMHIESTSYEKKYTHISDIKPANKLYWNIKVNRD